MKPKAKRPGSRMVSKSVIGWCSGSVERSSALARDKAS